VSSLVQVRHFLYVVHMSEPPETNYYATIFITINQWIVRKLTLARQILYTLALPCISRPMFYKICYMLISNRSFIWQLHDIVIPFEPNLLGCVKLYQIHNLWSRKDQEYIYSLGSVKPLSMRYSLRDTIIIPSARVNNSYYC